MDPVGSWPRVAKNYESRSRSRRRSRLSMNKKRSAIRIDPTGMIKKVKNCAMVIPGAAAIILTKVGGVTVFYPKRRKRPK